ncbi:MAG: hypothetical protein ACETWK_11880 [Candidatus Aminicenantaceae bacterium]
MLTLIKRFISSAIKKTVIFSLVLFFIHPIILQAKLKIIMEIKGDYLAYSYDYNYFYGKGNLKIKFHDLNITGDRIKIDFNSDILRIFGSVKLEIIDSSQGESSKEHSGDQFTLNLKAKKGELLIYQDEIKRSYLDLGLNEVASLSLSTAVLKEVTLSKIQSSFIYYTFTKLELLEDYKIIGYGVLCHVEGMESIYLKKFSLRRGTLNVNPGLRINKIWYTSSQGIVGEGELHLFQTDKTRSKTDFTYEERSVIKEHLPPNRILRVKSENKIIFNKNSILGLNGNYDSYSNWNTSLFFNRRFERLGSVNVDVSHVHPIGGFHPETWIKANSSFSSPRLGSIASSVGYEIQGQLQSALSYSRNIFRRFTVGINTSYNTVRESEVLTRTKILASNVSLSYRRGYFNVVTNYSLNSDLISHSSLSIPQISLNLTGLSFYHNLLHLSVSNNFYYYISTSQLTGKTTNYSDNLIFALSTNLTSLPFIDNLNFSLNAEELFREGREGYLSTGLVVNLRKQIVKNSVYLNSVYAYNTHRKNKKWFIEGTNSQNLLTYLEVSLLKKIYTNISLNFDPERGRLLNSFATFTYQLGRSWYINSSLQYDFLNKKFNNVDVFLIRDVKKFDIRLVWRYLTKQVFIEIVPK